VRFPKASPGERHAYLQFSRRSGDFAIVAVACTLRDGRLTLGLGGVEDTPIVLDGFSPREKPEVLGRKAREAVNPTESPRVPAIFRKELVEVLARRAVVQCLNSN
jgi:2-furoyl-CoA dehydrogenase FAD binding subunit